ncbi:MAG TPA: hypothetical protein VJB66_04720 [Candidatus Nanoarchaeia archaeon]|nr:hypothetical protein [Candidatus Nanoarchaeia archaeon]
MNEVVTEQQIQIMHRYSIIAFSLLVLMVFSVGLPKYIPALMGNQFIALIPFILSLWTIALMGIKHKVIGSIGFKHPTYHGKRAQIIGYALIGVSLYAVYLMMKEV